MNGISVWAALTLLNRPASASERQSISPLTLSTSECIWHARNARCNSSCFLG